MRWPCVMLRHAICERRRALRVRGAAIPRRLELAVTRMYRAVVALACAMVPAALPALAFAGPGAPSPAPAQTPDSYASAGERVTIAPGRALNLRCSGAGPRTVLLEAGGNADSATWFRVQPLLESARVCAYDRAGYGFSDPGPLPRDPTGNGVGFTSRSSEETGVAQG